MPVRLAHQSQAIQTVLLALQKDPRISRLYHPFVGNQQQQALAEKYLTGYGSLFAIDLKDTDFERLKTFVNALTLVTIGVSWGGFESLALPVFKGNNLAAVQKEACRQRTFACTLVWKSQHLLSKIFNKPWIKPMAKNRFCETLR